MRKFWKRESVTASRAFCCAAPAKLLRSAARTVLLATGSVTILDLNVDNRSAADRLKTAPSVAVDPKAAPRFGYEANSPPTNKEETKLPPEPSTSSHPSVKATKNDDAQVDPTQWNLWCVDQFDPDDLASTPLVCVAGSFSEEKHGRLFKAMRSWMHKLYRRRVLRGLLKFLNQEYDGRKRVVNESVIILLKNDTRYVGEKLLRFWLDDAEEEAKQQTEAQDHIQVC